MTGRFDSDFARAVREVQELLDARDEIVRLDLLVNWLLDEHRDRLSVPAVRRVLMGLDPTEADR